MTCSYISPAPERRYNYHTTIHIPIFSDYTVHVAGLYKVSLLKSKPFSDHRKKKSEHPDREFPLGASSSLLSRLAQRCSNSGSEPGFTVKRFITSGNERICWLDLLVGEGPVWMVDFLIFLLGKKKDKILGLVINWSLVDVSWIGCCDLNSWEGHIPTRSNMSSSILRPLTTKGGAFEGSSSSMRCAWPFPHPICGYARRSLAFPFSRSIPSQSAAFGGPPEATNPFITLGLCDNYHASGLPPGSLT